VRPILIPHRSPLVSGWFSCPAPYGSLKDGIVWAVSKRQSILQKGLYTLSTPTIESYLTCLGWLLSIVVFHPLHLSPILQSYFALTLFLPFSCFGGMGRGFLSFILSFKTTILYNNQFQHFKTLLHAYNTYYKMHCMSRINYTILLKK
jgi:hypothetical protein